MQDGGNGARMLEDTSTATGTGSGSDEGDTSAVVRAPETDPPLRIEDLDFSQWDRILVMCSGGKDSLACCLVALENAPKDRIELWHQDVDGREGSRLMDWPVTRDYVRAFAEAFGLPLRYAWREGGFEAEMNRVDQPTGAVLFEDEDGVLRRVGGASKKLNTRRKFPQVSADLSVRWCSSYLKIDVAAMAITSRHERYAKGKTLVITGERAEESSARAKYKVFEPHRTDNRDGVRRARHIDHLRPIHGWSEAQVWEIIRRHGVVPHPAYRAGFGRVSCSACIFASEHQLATLALHAPRLTDAQTAYEREFGTTIHRTKTLPQRIAKGTPYEAATPERMAACMSETYEGPILVDPSEWRMPAGAFGDKSGPT